MAELWFPAITKLWKEEPASLLLLPRYIHIFFFNKHSFNGCKHWLISRVLKNLNSTIFANVLFAVIEKCIFGHSDSAMPEMLPPHS